MFESIWAKDPELMRLGIITVVHLLVFLGLGTIWYLQRAREWYIPEGWAVFIVLTLTYCTFACPISVACFFGHLFDL
jgi:hypothetical protein